MRNILIIGAGKSSISLIDYLVEHAQAEQWQVTVADLTEELALQKTQGRTGTRVTAIDTADEAARRQLIAAADIVISMLPAALHSIIATDCLELRRHLVTPSYISPAMREMDSAVRGRGLLFMNEMGLDPGIDHMSAMQIIDRLRGEGSEVSSFRSHCGGLVAPESDTNSWHYKFSWNPRNVVLAGQGEGGMRWREDGRIREIGYHELFCHTTPVDLGADGSYESYPNRDSLKYISEYGLEQAATVYRGTLRVPPFCEAWDCLVQLGLTAPSGPCRFTTREEAITQLDLSERPDILYMLDEIGIFDQASFPLHTPPADSLLRLLETRWQMQPDDRDLVVMVHDIAYRQGDSAKRLRSSLYMTGTDSAHTAMAHTVGLPLAIVTRLILNGEIPQRGVVMPKHKEIYEPVMKELEAYGVKFKEVYL